MEFFSWKGFIIPCYNLLCKRGACFDVVECKLSCKIVKNCRIIGQKKNRAKKEQILSEVCMIKKGLLVLFTWDVSRKSMLKSLVYRPPDSSPRFTCKLCRTQKIRPNILASLLVRGMQRVNWLPPRTIVARVFVKIIFWGCPIIHSLSNGALLERLVNATLWCLKICLKSHMNVPYLWITSLLFDLNYEFINGSFAFSPG